MATETFVTDSNVLIDDMLSVDPFRSLYVHFGMLLGVEDFRTLDAYHRGKNWYHAAWLHRQGTVWGLGVEAEGTEGGAAPSTLTGEVRVDPGLAIDGLGRELYLPQAGCLNLGAWYATHREDAAVKAVVVVDDITQEHTFTGHVTIEFQACLDRQVPALSEPCDGASSTTAYSRVIESVRLSLHPGAAPDWRANGALPFHRVRLLFGLEQPLDDPENPGVPSAEDQAVLDARDAILSMPTADRPSECLRWFRHFSALDEIQLTPDQAQSGTPLNLFPESEPARVYLADLNNIRLRQEGDQWIVQDVDVDVVIRPVHLPTTTIQELVCGALGAGAPAPPPEGPTEEEEEPVPEPEEPGVGPANQPTSPGDSLVVVSDAGGPRMDAETVVLDGRNISVDVVGGLLLQASVAPENVSVDTFVTASGWSDVDVTEANFDQNSRRLDIQLAEEPAGNPVRLMIRGTGRQPVLGRNRVPLAGAVGGSPGSKHDGNDFVVMLGGN